MAPFHDLSRRFALLLLLVAGAASTAPLGTQAQSVGPPEVFARLGLIQAELDRVRFEMGAVEAGPAAFEVEGVAPREVYFQATTLFKKANRLSFEHTRERAEPPPPPTGEITPLEVLAVLDAALARIRLVKRELGIPERSPEPPVDASRTPTDVFQGIMTTNRQLNVLLDAPVAAADVYQQLTLAIGYAARLRARFPGDRLPAAPALERGARPDDVYRRLVHCFDMLRRLAEASELEMLTVTWRETNDGVEPGDVYDIATLVVSELAYLWSQLPDAEPPRPAFYPGRKLPSDVYQRAGLLEAQLTDLEALAVADPDWLRRGS